MTRKNKQILISSLLSFLTIGMGHVYLGMTLRGMIFFIFSFALSYLAILSGSAEQLPITLLIIICTALCLYGYAIIDASKFVKNDKIPKRAIRWIFCGLFYLINITFFSPILTSGFINQVGQSYTIHDNSMSPVIIDGDSLLADISTQQKYKRGDIVIFSSHTEKDYVKRIQGLPGDTIGFSNGSWFIDQKRMEGDTSSLQSKLVQEKAIIPEQKPIILLTDEYFVVGDNLENSYDSRHWGPLKKTAIKGKAKVIFWSKDTRTNRIRWQRLNTSL